MASVARSPKGGVSPRRRPMEVFVGWSIPLGRVGGTAIRLHFTFFLFLLWIGMAFFIAGGAARAAGGIAFLILLFFCVVLHEFGHILAARHFGIRTPQIVLLPIGGVSQLERIPEKPREELLMALAGPAVTLAIAVLLILALGGLPDPRALMAPVTPRVLFEQLAYANLTLLVFNLLPAFPLDGGRVLRALLAARLGHLRGTRIAASIGKGAAVVFGLVGLMSGNVVLVLIAVFIFIAAGSEAGFAQLRGIAFNIPAGEMMISAFESLPRGAPVIDAAEALIRTSQQAFPVVDGDGCLAGLLTQEGIVRALSGNGAMTPVDDFMQTDIPTISQWQRLDDSLDLLQGGAPAIAVTGAEGRLVGLITWENLLEALMIARARGSHVRNVAKRVVTPAHPYLS